MTQLVEQPGLRAQPRPTLRAAGRALPGPAVVVASVVLLLLVLAALAPGLLGVGPPDTVDPINALAGPSGAHPLGTDQLGRDVLSRVVHGTRLSLLIGLGASAIAVVGGSLFGVLAACGGRAVGELVLRVTDVLLAFPGLLLALLVVAVLGPGTTNATLAIGVSLVPGFVRLAHSQAQVVLRSDYVLAATTFGYRWPTVVVRHILPNSIPPVLVLATVSSGSAIIIGASLGFLGLGPEPPTPEWGAMLAEARDFLDVSWTLAAAPGAAVVVAALSINVVGRRLRRRFEGRSAA